MDKRDNEEDGGIILKPDFIRESINLEYKNQA